jgi:hypothetical protein
MTKFLLLFIEMNLVLRNLPFFIVLGCVVSVGFPIMYPNIETGAQFSEMANDCAKETYSKFPEREKGIAAINKCIEFKRTEKNAAQNRK